MEAVEAVEEMERVEEVEGVEAVEQMEEVQAWKQWKKGRMEEGSRPANQEKGSYSHAQTPISALPASPPRYPARRLSRSGEEAAGDCPGNRLQRVAGVAHHVLA
jgi:hypothetical protein